MRVGKLAFIPALLLFAACSDHQPTIPRLDAAKGGRPQPPADPVIAFVNLKRGGGTEDQLLVINADGSNKTVVYAAPHLLRPSWSPNGDSIVFRRDSKTAAELWIVGVKVGADGKPQGTNAHRLTDQCGRSFGSPYIGCEPAWSPTRSEIAFTEVVTDPVTNQTTTNLWLITVNGVTATLLYAAPGRGNLQSPTWSPDGNQIAVVEGLAGITILTRAGTVTRQVPFPAFPDPAGFTYVDNVDWSRKSLDSLAFSGLPVVGARTVYTLDISQTPATWTPVVAGYDPTWSPDDAKLAFIQGSGQALVSRVLATGASTTLAVDALDPNWSRKP